MYSVRSIDMRRRPKQPEPPEPWWTVYLMHGRSAERLGIIRARDEAEAIDKAMAEFKLKTWQRCRVLVGREAD